MKKTAPTVATEEDTTEATEAYHLYYVTLKIGKEARLMNDTNTGVEQGDGKAYL